jgi:hypothetical protein
VVGYVSPVLLGSGRYPALRSDAIPTIAAAPRLVLDEVTLFGEDVRIISYPKGA